MLGMKELLRAFEHRSPEIVFEWKDSETDAKGWVVINSLRGGAAGGGTRMRAGLDRHEVESLAKTMEVKFTVSGPAIGGAKSGIDFDPHDPRKNEVLDRWFKVVTPLLKNYYGTGGDLNIDEIHDVIPLTEEYGLWHPQEGILNGHFKVNESNRIHQIGQLRYGVSKVLEDNTYSPDIKRKYKVADMITGYGVSESIRHYYQLFGSDSRGKRAVIQGWGNVAAAAAFYLAKLGVKIVGIIDRAGGLINQEGFSESAITQLFLDRKGNELNSPDLMSFEQIQKEIWGVKADIFVPAAASRLVSKDQIQQLMENGLEVISSGANVPFADQEIFYGPVMEFADQHVAVIPDFIANCGMARVFAYLMQRNIEMSDDAIFSDVSKVIFEALEKIRKSSADHTHISSRAYEIALKQLI